MIDIIQLVAQPLSVTGQRPKVEKSETLSIEEGGR